MIKKLPFAILTCILLLTACSTNEESELKISNIEDLKTLVHDYTTDQITAQSASITSNELIITNDDDSTTVYPLLKDEFFVSIAPYIETTHPCAIHSLTSCQGELVNEEFDVFIADADGTIVIDQKMTSESNGFIDLWLPRNRSYQVKITHGEKTVESEISTFDNDHTCITTMQLK